MKSCSKFQQNDTVDGLYKTSLFKNLFRDRKSLFGDYPCASKGLVFPEPTLKSGTCSFSFKTNATVDKMTTKYDEREFSARYKKATDKYDVSYKAKYAPGLFGLFKYEERGTDSPAYVFGVDTVQGSLAFNSKVNLQTGNLKSSALVSCDDILKSLKVGADMKMLGLVNNLLSGNAGSILSSENLQFNLGGCYATRAGLTALAYNSKKQMLTLNHSLQVDKYTTGLVEVVVGTSNFANVTPKMAIGVGYQLDRDHQLRCRVNDAAQVQVCVKKDFTQNVSVLAAACVDLQSKGVVGQVLTPSIGFKLVNKV